MSRYRKLDRNLLLDAAEAVLRDEGAHMLSIRNVAAKCGVSKGGVQSNFGTIDKLVEALFERWGVELQDAMDQLEDKEQSVPLSETDRFIAATRQTHFDNPERSTAMTVLMTQSEERIEKARAWLKARLPTAEDNPKTYRQERLNILVTEALLIVKSMRITPLSDEEWHELFDDFDKLVELSKQAAQK